MLVGVMPHTAVILLLMLGAALGVILVVVGEYRRALGLRRVPWPFRSADRP
jgi:hypothetical protein